MVDSKENVVERDSDERTCTIVPPIWMRSLAK